MMIYRSAHLLAALLLVAPFIYPQAQQVKDKDDEPVKLSAELVVVDTQVLNKKTGRVVGGLTKEDFTLYEDGVRQDITHFSQDKLPLSIVLLLDVSGSVQPVISQIRDEGMTALKLLRLEDEVAVMIFGLWARVAQDFTKDREAVIRTIAALEFMGPWIREGTYIDEAVYQAAAYMGKASNPDSRRAIIIVTDNISNQPHSEGHSRNAAIEQLSESGIVVSALVVSDFDAQASLYKKSGGFILEDSVSPYVSETGGLNMQTNKTDASARLTELVDRLRTRYSLGYSPTNSNRDGKFRKIKLQVASQVEKREGRISVIARKGYYAPKPSSPAPASEKKSVPR